MAKKKDKGRSRKERAEALRKRMKKGRESSGGNFRSYLDPEKIKDVKWYNPAKDESSHTIDIIPYIAGKNDTFGMEGEETHSFEYYVHKNVGAEDATVLCRQEHFDEPCPVCEDRLKKRKKGVSDKVWKALFPKKRNLYNIVSYDTKKEFKKGLQLFDVSWYSFEKFLLTLSAGKTVQTRKGEKTQEEILFSDPEEGMSISFDSVPKSFPSGDQVITFNELTNHAFVDRDGETTEEFLADALCLDDLIIDPGYDEVKAMYSGSSDDEGGKKNKKKKGKKDVEEDEDEDEEEDEEEVEDEDEEEDEEEDDEDEDEEEDDEVEDEDEDDEDEDDEDEDDEDDDEECPHGYEFGVDTGEKDECDECKNFDNCLKESEAKEAAAKKAKGKAKGKVKGKKKK